MKPTATATNWIRRLSAIAAAMALWWTPTALPGEPDGCEPGWAEGVFPVNPLDIGLNGAVLAMTEFDDGSGSNLIVGGEFSSPANSFDSLLRIALWNGKTWESIGAVDGSRINALSVFDDGSGPALYAGGRFSSINGVPIRNIARWDGTSWTSLLGGTESEVRDLTVYRNPVGVESLIVAGDFGSVDGLPSTQHIASWNGSSWTPLGGQFGTGGLNGPVHALEVHEENGQQSLYVGGSFFVITDGLSYNIARWNGFFWSRLGGGVGESRESTVHAIEVVDHGTGPIVYAGGDFENLSGLPTSGIQAWDGSSWTDLDGGISGGDQQVYALESLMIDDQPSLLVGGSFGSASDLEVPGIALWNGTAWSALPSDVEFSQSAVFRSFYVPADDAIADLVVGGSFSSPDLRSTGVARWNDGIWDKPANVGLNGPVQQFLIGSDDDRLLVRGDFTIVGDEIETEGFAYWTGGAWETASITAIDTGLGEYAGPSVFEPLPVVQHDDGSGPTLFTVRYSGDDFDGKQQVVRWNGSEWVPLGVETTIGFPILSLIRGIVAIESGPARGLYVAGSGMQIDGEVVLESYLRWDGKTWTPIDLGPFRGLPGSTMTAAKVGKNELLYVGFGVGVIEWDGIAARALPIEIEGQAISGIVKQIIGFDGKLVVLLIDSASPEASLFEWDGQAWQQLPLSPGQIPLQANRFDRLFVTNSPAAEHLYATRWFVEANQVDYDFLRFDGTNWSVVASEVNGPIYAVTAHDDGSGPALYIGGDFTEVDGVPSGFMAKRPFCDEQPCPADVTGDGVVNLDDLDTVLFSFGQQTHIGDTNGDEVVDMTDLDTVLSAFGSVCK